MLSNVSSIVSSLAVWKLASLFVSDSTDGFERLSSSFWYGRVIIDFVPRSCGRVSGASPLKVISRSVSLQMFGNSPEFDGLLVFIKNVKITSLLDRSDSLRCTMN